MNIEKIVRDKFLVFDGAMGTMLQIAGLGLGEMPEVYNIEQPDKVYEIHKAYIEAGSDIITTNTFGANSYKLNSVGLAAKDIIKAAVTIAKRAAYDKYVALDIGPIGRLMEPIGDLSFDEAYNLFKEQVIAGEESGADLILIETMSDLYEAKAAILAAKENSSLPVICTMTFQKDGRTLTGTDIFTMVNVIEGLGVAALGINCSLGPVEIMPFVKEILKYSSIPVIVQPNAGLPRVEDGETVFDVSIEEFTACIEGMAKSGALIFGGCCGTNPDFIKGIKRSLDNIKPIKVLNKNLTAVSSSTKTVIIGDKVKIIGERINPTGKAKFKQALKNNDIDYILNEAFNQKDKGADILDVNVGIPDIDEKNVMLEVIKKLQAVINLPLQIDSSNCEVIEKAARYYNGKPLINSVNGKKEVLDSIMPIVKKYGACVIALTLDENGIPDSAEERFLIAQNIIQSAREYGVPKENIIMDCLVLTASAKQAEVIETLKAVSYVKEKLFVKTTLGVSNVSFGLPAREIINRTFLAMALYSGLDAPIMNPLDEGMMDIINSFKVLLNQDSKASEFISKYSNIIIDKKDIKTEKSIDRFIIDGLKDEAINCAAELLKTNEPLVIVNEYIIPSLELVGKKFETGEIFLPQLIQSAEVVKGIFTLIKQSLNSKGNKSISKGKIILATVKGDIHDIGKNIVKVLLENYGYEIIDLGKDVACEVILDSVMQNNVKLVGLSALMTTTVKSMEYIIKVLKEKVPDCKIMVGGAVLTEEYAKKIGADYYAKDAQASVKIAGGLELV